MTRALKRASEEAEQLGHPVWGSEHIVLALTRLDYEEAGRAPGILAQLGITEDVVRPLIERHCEGERESNGGHDHVRAGPEVAYIVTHTRWLAIYLRHTPAASEHLLLGTLQHHKAESKVLRKLGLTFEDAYAELTGAEPPPELRPERPLYVPEAQLALLLRYLPEVVPDGMSYAFNFDDEFAWFSSSSDDFEVYVQRALEAPASRSWPRGTATAVVADVVWSDDGGRVALWLNGRQEAALDFVKGRAVCRTNFRRPTGALPTPTNGMTRWPGTSRPRPRANHFSSRRDRPRIDETPSASG